MYFRMLCNRIKRYFVFIERQLPVYLLFGSKEILKLIWSELKQTFKKIRGKDKEEKRKILSPTIITSLKEDLRPLYKSIEKYG